MSIARRIADFLAEQHVNYEMLRHEPASSLVQAIKSLNISEETVLRALILKAGDQLVCAVLPLNYMIDFKALEQSTGRRYEPVAALSVGELFQDCDPGIVPPLAMLYDIESFYDEQIANSDTIVFEAGASDALLRMSTGDFLKLIDSSKLMSFSRPQQELSFRNNVQSNALDQFIPDHEFHQRLNDLYALPPVPALLQKLQAYTQSNKKDKSVLLNILADENELAAQLQRLAIAPAFSPDAPVRQQLSGSEAIERLGVDLSAALLQGLLVWHTLSLPVDGPLGKASQLSHACMAAQLSYHLISSCGGIRDVDSVVACQTAMLHNAGYLLLSHLFKPEYFLFNRMVLANPDIPVVEIEKQMLAYGQASDMLKKGHTESGSWLLQSWHFDEVITTVCHHHHNADYHGPNQEYVHLLILVNYLLGLSGIGERCVTDLPEKSMLLLGVDAVCVENAKESILKKGLSDIFLGHL